MALDLDYESATYNAYADIATMDAIISSFKILNGGEDGGWNTLEDDAKEVFIKASTSQIDSFNWKGERNSLIIEPHRTQPRSGLKYQDESDVPSDSIPSEIQNYMGCWIINTMLDNTNSTINVAGIKKKKVGDMEIEYLSSNQSGNFITEIEKCQSKHLPSNWFISDLVLGGIGTIGLTRRP